MERYTKHMPEKDPREFTTDENYNIVYKRVKLIKGFYSHLKVYLIVNAIIIISSFNRDFIGDSGFWKWHTFSTALFWGIGLLGHALSVFGRDLFFSNDWEQKKIQKYMENEKMKTQKWE